MIHGHYEKLSFEQKLQNYQKKINKILESFTDAFFEVDQNWIVTYWNKEAERLMLKQRADIIGKNLWKVYKQAIPLKFYSESHRAIKEHMAVRFEEYFPQKKIWLEVAAFPSGAGLSVYFKDITARKLATEQLKQEKQKYIDLFNLSPLPHWVYDLKTLAFLDVNQAAIKQYGYSKKEFLKMTILDIRPEEDLHELNNIVQAKVLEGQFHRAEVRHRKKDGTLLFVVVEGNPIEFNGRKARIGLAIDQTEQLEAKMALAKSEQRFKKLVQDGSDMIAILNSAGEYQYVSPTSTSILGISPPQLLGKKAFDFIHADDLERTQQQFTELNQGKQLKLSPFRFRNHKGKYLWIETIITNMMDDPTINGLVTNSRDITKRIEAELRTQESINRFNIVAKATSDAIWDWNMQTGQIIWNQGIKEIFGYKSIPKNEQSWEKQVHPTDLERVVKHFENLIRQKKSRSSIEYRFRCADGSYKYVLDRSFLLFNENKEPIRMIGSMQDVTERINHISAIETQNAILKDISWSQAHEVRAPLASIMGLTSLLNVYKETSPALAELLQLLMVSANELDGVIKNILKKTAGK